MKPLPRNRGVMYTFKTNCPKCGKKKGWKTKVVFEGDAMIVSSAHCFKCGHTAPKRYFPKLGQGTRAKFSVAGSGCSASA